MTTAPGVFAAGDIAFGPRLIISAVADGKKAAEEIDRYLRGPAWKPSPATCRSPCWIITRWRRSTTSTDAFPCPTIALDRRTGIAEVEVGYTEEQARLEATRCLKCWINTIFEGNEAEGTECILCGGCVDVCPENCLQLVPLSQLRIPETETRKIQESLTSDSNRLCSTSPPTNWRMAKGSVMVKDETICIRCGLCAQRCPAHTITMEGFEVYDHDPEALEALSREK